MAIEALVGWTGSVEIELRDQHDQVTTVFDRAGSVNWEVPDEIELTDEDDNPLDAQLRFVAATGEGQSVRMAVSLDANPDPDVQRAMRFESEDITVNLPPPGEPVSGSVKVTLHQTA